MYLKIRVKEKVDLSDKVFAMFLWQKANFLGTERSSFRKFDTAVFHYGLVPSKFLNRFEKHWKGYGA
jgi:hypothetical protein